MPFSKEDELELWKKYKHEGDQQAKKKLMKSLRPLIQHRANQFRNSGVPMPSIELEAMKLAKQALDTYDPSKSALNTHVTNYLKKVSRFVTRHQNVASIPEPRAHMMGRYKTIFANIEDEKGREPTMAELSDYMHVPIKEIERIQLEQRNELGIELESDDDEAGGFFFDVDERAQDAPEKKALEFVYFDADPIDKKIMEYNFGMGASPKMNFTGIKDKLGLSDTELKKRRKKIATNIKDLI